ncbi:MAG: rRNA (guanine2069-N7)-methyltransferase / rRNA (guanine2445-N2)-methyltransferase [Candidatus Woesearchaeota archaeon]|nr:rRNA (guanine2069-N7)-methyltransferase / rRNA (guanine2445-N2)-methyltransferase [Candidatus Woesearchaeota archaeon]MDN5327791.1 rRNA (guanine2069-N7)-methyltransferase / rRNA (guanine2445-N2)-methyltransferase [Candidatus Woesearchaeota archaeon]
MKLFSKTDFGLENFLKKEFEERFEIKGSLVNNIFLFEANLEKAIELSYLSQSISDLGFVLFEKELNEINEQELIKQIFEKLDLKSIPNLRELSDFSVSIETNDEIIKSKSFELANQLADSLSERFSANKNFKSAKRKFTLSIQKINNSFHCVLGLSLFNIDLSRRTYRVFVNKTGLKPLTAFALVLFSELNRKQKVVDFLCKDNTLILEAYHYLSNRSVRFYDKTELSNSASIDFEFDKIFNKVDGKEFEGINLFATDMAFPNIDAARKNAKIAGIAKKIRFSKIDLRFFDVSFDEPFDKAITYISLSKYKNNDILDKIKKYVLPVIKLDLNIITNLTEEFEKRGFNIIKKVELNQKGLKLNLLKILPE